MNDLVKGDLLGKHIAHLAVVEWQKRGLPHVHILLIVADSDDLQTAEDVDNVISAELPLDPNEPGLSNEEVKQWGMEAFCPVRTKSKGTRPGMTGAEEEDLKWTSGTVPTTEADQKAESEIKTSPPAALVQCRITVK